MASLTIEVVEECSQTLLDSISGLLPQLSSSSQILTRCELRAMLACPCTTLFVAKRDKRIVGIICLVVVQMPTGLRSYLGDLVVDSSHRRAGVGEALLVAAIERAKLLGVRTIDATTRPARASAMNLYAKVGLRTRDTLALRYTTAPEQK
jgi:ribosomal protein S18 acetylase RimI-like enzyme